MKVFLSRSQSALPPKMLLATAATFSATPGASPADVVDDVAAPAPPDEVSDDVPVSTTGGGLFVEVAGGTKTDVDVDVEVGVLTLLVLVGVVEAGLDVVVDDVVVVGGV